MHTINVVQRHNRNFLAIHLCVTNNRFGSFAPMIWREFDRNSFVSPLPISNIINNQTMIIIRDTWIVIVVLCGFLWNRIFVLYRQLRMWETELKSMPYVRTTNFQILQLSGIKWNVPQYSIPFCAYVNTADIQYFFCYFVIHTYGKNTLHLA